MTIPTVEFQKLHNNQSTTFTAGHAPHNTAHLSQTKSHLDFISSNTFPYLGQGHE